MSRLFCFLLFGVFALTVSVHAVERPPLHEAARDGDRARVESLLALGADVNSRDVNGETALNWAMANPGETEIVELLLAKGVNVNSKSNDSETALHGAAHLGRKEAAALLLAKGADVNAMSKYGTPLHYAINSGQKEMVALLLASGADLSAKGMDIRARDKSGWTPREEAVELGKPDLVEMLDEHLRWLEEQVLRQAQANPRAALVQLTARLNDNPQDQATRHVVIKLASGMKPAPAIPEEARRHFVEGTVIVKAAKNPAQQGLAAQSFTEALKIAPWWSDAYYNLGVAQELAEQYEAAEQSFGLYLLSNPGDSERREVQDRIYALAAKRRLAGAQ